jgi:mannitol/fructose-specific phosphotransferase system IIA component (Ntr-type)
MPSIGYNSLSPLELLDWSQSPMRLSELLNPSAVTLSIEGGTKPEVLAELVAVLEKAHGFNSGGQILERVLHREEMMSTAIGFGVAIPHGKADSVTRMAAACAVSAGGLDFGSDDGASTHLIVLFVSPDNRATEHVRVLAHISRLLKEESVRRDLRAAGSPAAFLAVVQAAESALIP